MIRAREPGHSKLGTVACQLVFDAGSSGTAGPVASNGRPEWQASDWPSRCTVTDELFTGFRVMAGCPRLLQISP